MWPASSARSLIISVFLSNDDNEPEVHARHASLPDFKTEQFGRRLTYWLIPSIITYSADPLLRIGRLFFPFSVHFFWSCDHLTCRKDGVALKVGNIPETPPINPFYNREYSSWPRPIWLFHPRSFASRCRRHFPPPDEHFLRLEWEALLCK